MALTARRYFPGKAETWLEARLAEVLDEIVTGKTTSSWNAGDTSASKQIDMRLSAERRRDMILHDLSILNPTDYPPRSLQRVTRTVPSYI